MAGRGFCVKIELDLQAITCPGVWLCPNGRVVLRIKTLNSCVETCHVPPAFPLLFYDKFTFTKIFMGVVSLAELQNTLENELIFTELVQWSSPKKAAVVLATFETNLADLLYPAPCFKGLLAGSEVDLLMEPTKYFPGILAPKIEVSTRTSIEEMIGICEPAKTKSRVINPKVINSKNGKCIHRKRPSTGIIRQRKVCHSQGNAMSHSNRMVLEQRQPSIDGTTSSFSSLSNNRLNPEIDCCYHKHKTIPVPLHNATASKTCEYSPFWNSSRHIFDNCPVCSKYNCYFTHNYDGCAKVRRTNYGEHENLQKMYDSSEYFHDSCAERREYRPKSAPHEGSLRDSSSSSMFRAKSRGKDVKSNCATNNTCKVNYFECEKDRDKQGFYKNLEKFYKRMYKQAKMRAQQVDCA